MAIKGGVKKYLPNMSWMMGDKVFFLGVNFLASILVARYLGPEKFGVLSYATSLVAIFASAGSMGLAGLIVREVVKYPDQEKEILGSAFSLKYIGMLFSFLVMLIYAIAFELGNKETFWVFLIVATGVLFQPFDVIDYWFQSQVKAKYIAYSRVLSVLISTLLKVAFVLTGASLVFFSYANLTYTILCAIFLCIFYKNITKKSPLSWSVSFTRMKALIKSGGLIYIGSILAIIYIKIDQVMLKWLVGTDEVGIYAVAAQLSEAWYFIPVAIVSSLFPSLIKVENSDREKYKVRLQQIFDLLFVLAAVIALAVTLVSDPVMSFFFGKEYSGSAPILNIHIWAGVFIFMRALFSRWILIENALVFSILTQGAGAVINVILNFFLIKEYGGVGAAYATLLSYAMASYGALFFYKKTRPVFLMMTKSIFSPLRLLLKIRRVWNA